MRGVVTAVVFAWTVLLFAMPGAVLGAGEPDGFRIWTEATLPGPPEGLAVDSQGRLYATVAHDGRVVRLDGKGGWEHYAWVPEDHGHGVLIGITFDGDDNLFGAYVDLRSRYASDPVDTRRMQLACRDATDVYSGVYRVDAKTRAVTPFATRREGWPFCVPDDVDVDAAGNVYVSDVVFSGIWKINADGSRVELWSDHPLLDIPPEPSSGISLGTNVLVLDAQEKNVYAGTDGHPMVVRVPINADGSAGEPVIHATGFTLLDGVDIDADGFVYVSEPMLNRISVLSPDGLRRREVAGPDSGLIRFPTSLVYIDGTLCVTNFGMDPALSLKTVTCMKGFARP